MSQENVQPVYAIGAFRMVGGLSTWLTPNLLARVYGGTRPDAAALLWSRLGGSREIALGVGPMVSEGEARRRWLLFGLACDFGDMAATLLVANRRRGDRLSPFGAGLAMATYSVSALLTGWALRSSRAEALEAAGRSE
jgi:hypothetical protein